MDQAISPSSGSSSENGKDSQILGAFQGDLDPLPVPIAYRLGILLVTIVMVILPLMPWIVRPT